MDFSKLVKAICLPQDVPSKSDYHLIELENQVQRLMEAHLASMQPTQVNKVTTLYEICSGPHDTQYCLEDPEQAFVEYASSRKNEIRNRQFTTSLGQEVWRKPPTIEGHNVISMGTISILHKPTKGSFSHITSTEQKQNPPSSLIRVIFVNSIIILSKEDEAKEEDGEKSTATDYKGHKTTDEMEDKVESEEEVEEENEEKLKRRGGNRNILKLSHMNELMVFGKPFVEATELVHNKEEGTIVFERDKERIIFKMPHKMDMFKHVDFTDIGTDSIPHFVIKSDDDNCEKPHYSYSLDLGPEYKYDEYSVQRHSKFELPQNPEGKKKGRST
ncbi:hypothetical protein Tco_1295182 [Tanacetum coccineum]